MEKVKIGKYISELSVKNKFNKPYPVYSVTNSNGFCTEYFTKDVSSNKKTNYKIVPFGCFAYNPSRINVGSIACQESEEEVIVSPIYIVFKCSDDIDRKYLFYFFKSNYGKRLINSSVSGSVRFNLKFNSLCNFEINERTLDEQKEVVDVFENIKSLITTEQKQLLFLDELIKSRFNEMFGDPLQNEKGFNVVPLKELSTFNSVKGKVQISDRTWLLNLDMVESNSGRIIEKLRTSKVDGSTIEFDTNCVLYSKLRPYLNKVVIPDESGFATSEMVSLRCDSNRIKREYLATALRHKSFVDFINSKTAGAKMPRANMDELRKLKMPLPPFQEQQEFSRFIAEIDKLKFASLFEKYMIFSNKNMFLEAVA